MKIIRFSGGLGNQLFQYAYYKNMQKFDEKTLADITAYEKCKYQQGLELEKVFGIKLNTATHHTISKLGYSSSSIKDKLWKKILKEKKTYYKEKVIGFDENINNIRNKNMYLDGFWQSYRYFLSICTTLQQELQCKAKLSEKTVEAIETIQKTNCVAIHIRRTDYINGANPHFINLSETNYYNKAIQYIKNQINNITFCVFSDGIEWVKNNFALENAIYVDWNQDENSYQDMIIMSYCQGVIMANSTFSWWGAWLNPRNINKCVICPKQWYNVTNVDGRTVHTQDLILPEWKTIEIK